MKKCRGCGITLQEDDETKLGYVVSLSQDYCQRCFRLKHYGHLSLDIKNDLKFDEVLSNIEKQSGLVLWVVDLWDLLGSMRIPLNRYLANRDIVMVATKSDLLPCTVSNEKIRSFLKQQLKDNNIDVKEICLVGNHGKQGKYELKKLINRLAVDKNVILVGNANSGKSTLLTALTGKEVTVSFYPGTSPVMHNQSSDGFIYFDTPGLTNPGSCLQHINTKDLTLLLPQKTDRRLSFQIHEDQSFAIGGLVRIDFKKVKKATVVFYCANTLNIHRGKAEKADELWSQHYGELLYPVIGEIKAMRAYNYKKNATKIDICINGLGFIAVSGDVASIRTMLNEKIDISVRKGMI